MPGLGDTLTFRSDLYDKPPEEGGVLVNATSVALTITLPDGTTTTPTVVNPPATTGKYFYRYVTTSLAGPFKGRWLFTLATGNTSEHTEEFNVEPADPGYIVGLAQVKAHLNMTATDSARDEELKLMIAAATAKIEDRCGSVARRTVTNERHSGGCEVIYLRQSPAQSLTSVTPVAGGTPITVNLLDLDPDTGRVAYLDGFTWFPYGLYYWTYVAGMSVVPAGLQLAALNFIKGSWETQRGAAGLPLQGGPDEYAVQPGMGLVNWRLEQDLKPFLSLPGIA
jgi:hypothetical protein